MYTDMLNEEQLKIFNNIVSDINDKLYGLNNKKDLISNSCILTGRAGTGKSFLTGIIISYLYEKGIKFKCTSTTHEAVKVLRNSVSNFIDINDENYTGVKNSFSTIHSYLKLKTNINFQNGTIELKSSNSQLAKTDVLIIDEISMVGEELFNYLKEYYGEYYKYVLFIGDKYQLSSVNDNIISDNNIFNFGIKIYELKNTVRQENDNPIINIGAELVKSINDILKGKDSSINSAYDFLKIIKKYNKNNKIRIIDDYDDFLEDYISKKEEEFRLGNQNVYDYFLGTYTNKNVNLINSMVREIIYDYNNIDYNTLNTEDIIILQDPATRVSQRELHHLQYLNSTLDEIITEDRKDNSRIIFSNGTVLKIKKMGKLKKVKFKLYDSTGFTNARKYVELFYYNCNVLSIEDNKEYYINLVDISSLDAFAVILDNLSKTANRINNKRQRANFFRKFYLLKELFLDYKFSYAKTLHKFQGGTINKTVYLDLSYLPWNNIENTLRLLYVGITRSKNNVCIFI